MKEKFVLAVVAITAFPAIASAYKPSKPKAAPLTQAVLYIEDRGKFEVLHSRAQSTSTGAVFFGLIGAGIEEGNRKSNDEEKEQAILVHIPDDACHNTLVTAMTERLAEKGFALSVIEGKPPKKAGEEFLIRLEIDACGFRMPNTNTQELHAYVTAQYQIFKPGDKTSKKKDEMAITGSERKLWERWLAEFDVSVEEFRAVKAKAGRRLANKLIYLR